MDLILYAGTKDENLKWLVRIVEELSFIGNRNICRTLDSLKKHLLRPKMDPLVSVLYTVDMKDLEDLLSIGEILSDVSNILILPDGREKTVAEAHLLRPRFLSYADSDFRDVAAVLKRMSLRAALHQGHGIITECRSP